MSLGVSARGFVIGRVVAIGTGRESVRPIICQMTASHLRILPTWICHAGNWAMTQEAIAWGGRKVLIASYRICVDALNNQERGVITLML
jgi:hypothetical protein